MDYREIPKNKILKLPATPGFKGWRNHFTQDSITHPAKMNLNLLRWILRTYTKSGEIVLDPMAGTGSTIVLASLLGRHGVAVEYEPKFCEMIKENIKRSERHSTLTPRGSMICVQGDARELSKLKESNTIITSPPYSSTETETGSEKGKRGGDSRLRVKKDYSEVSKGNISNLPHGAIETIITSPPYGEAQSGGGIATKGYDGPKHSPTDLVGERSYMPDKFEEGNISRLKYGESVDAVIASPPYEATCLDGRDMERRIERLKEAGHDPKDFIGGQARDATLKPYDEIDAVVSSPPYGNRLSDEAVQDGDEARISYRQAIDSIVTSPPYEQTISNESGGDMRQKEKQSLSLMREYSEDSDNIGNLKSESYLEAMLQVYRECYKILKPEGVMVLVTKNFIRNKKVVRLDEDTIKLCKTIGFHLSDRWYFELPQRSFWRILYKRRYPDIPEVEYEDVLLFKRA